MEKPKGLLRHKIGDSLKSEIYYHESEIKKLKLALIDIPKEIEEHEIRISELSDYFHQLYNNETE